MNPSKVIILTNNTLCAVGLRSIFESAFNMQAYIGDKSYISSFNNNKEPDLFFVDSQVLIENIGFFLPRKSKTILLVNHGAKSDDFNTLCVDESESDIISNINLILEKQNHNANNTTSTLSQREIEVLRLIASGRLNKEIAQELNISVNTVLTHRKNITAKLGIKSVSGLSFYAMMNGII